MALRATVPLGVSTECPMGLRPTKTDKDLPQAANLFSMVCSGSSTERSH